MFYPQCEPNFKRLYIPRLSQKVCFICTLFKTLNKVSSVATFLLNFNSPLGERPYNSKICILKAIITDDCWIFLNITVSVPSIRSALTESIVWINSDIIDMKFDGLCRLLSIPWYDPFLPGTGYCFLEQNMVICWILSWSLFVFICSHSFTRKFWLTYYIRLC